MNLCSNKERSCVFRCVASAAHFLLLRRNIMNVVIKKVDKLGRIVLPMSYRKALGLDTDSEVVLNICDGVITVEACADTCKICGTKQNVNNNFFLCSECIDKVKNL